MLVFVELSRLVDLQLDNQNLLCHALQWFILEMCSNIYNINAELHPMG